MAEIKKDDIFEPGTIEAPLEMAKNMDKLLESIQGIIRAGKQSEAVLETATSTKKLTDETKNLSTAQTELDKVQKQFATSTQKLSDEYLANKRAINAVNDEVKKKLELGDREAKEITAKNASLKQLEAALLANRKAYADLSSEQARTSKSGQELINIIQSQDRSVKALRDSMGQAQAHVGGYREALESLAKVNPELASGTESAIEKISLFVKLISGPVVAGLAALFAGFKIVQNSIEAYTETTAEGAAAAKSWSAQWHAAQEIVRQGYIDIGKAIVDSTSDKNGGSSLLVRAALFLNLKNLAGALEEKTEEQYEINLRNKKLKEDTLRLDVEGSEKALEASKALFAARDKIRNTDLERLHALDKGEAAILAKEDLEKKVVEDRIALIRTELYAKGAIFSSDEKAMDLLHNKSVLQHALKDQVLELGKAEGELNNIEQGFFDSGRRRQALRISATDDIIKRTVEGYKIELEANDKTETAIINKKIETNNRIIGNNEFTLDEQLQALADNQVQQSKLIDLGAEKEKRAAADGAIARVEVDTKALRKILDNEKLTAIERTQAIFDERVKAVKIDKAYLEQVNSIEEAASLQRQQIVKTGEDKVAKTIVDSEEYFLALRRQGLKDYQVQEVRDLNERLTTGQIGIRKYNAERNKIVNAGAKADLDAQVDAYTDELKALKEYLNKKEQWTADDAKILLDTEKKLADAKEKQSEAYVNRVRLNLEKQKQLEIAFRDEAYKATITFGNNLFAAQLQDSQMAMAELNSRKADELALAGDNADAKLVIEQKYNKKLAEETKRNLKLRQDQAIFDKAIAATEVVIKTAQAIADQLLFFPVSIPNIALIAGIGAVQEAAILSRPIPKFELGTKSSPEGFAIVGEKGSELIKQPGKDWTISTDSASMVKLAAGSEVVPHEETIRRLAMGSVRSEAFVDGANFALHGKIAALQETIKDIGAQTVKAIEASKVDFEQHGSILYKVIKKADGSRQLIRAKSISQ